ncbi:hypothetical protein BH09GEM1_BH09GEM1_36710 [soil metagenome]
MSVETLEVAAPSLVSVERTAATPANSSASVTEWLIDNAIAYRAIIAAMRRARRSVCISQLAFDADCEAYTPGQPTVRLLDELVGAWRTRALDVRILLNATLLVDTASPLRKALAAMEASAIEVRGISRFPQLLHAKVLIVDGREAFLIGSPFVNGYWDDSSHQPGDPRRPMRELGGRPLHDLSVRLTGPVVAELEAEFDTLWINAASSAETERPRLPTRAAPKGKLVGGSAVRVTRPALRSTHADNGRADILAAMLRGIESARDLLYIEHQYLSSRCVVDALTRALDRAPALEIVALVNQNPDVTAYRGWQNERLEESGLSQHPRFGLFALWSSRKREARIELNQVFVHSKLITVDDRWATFGSANIDGVSLHSYGADFSSRLGRRIFRGVRNFDVNVEMRSKTEGIDESIVELRTSLWNEHLGMVPSTRPHGGWLGLWRTRAAENISALNGNADDAPRGSFVLAYSTVPTPSGQLRALGVRDREELVLRFQPSWLEVHCSPNWIRNMFA